MSTFGNRCLDLARKEVGYKEGKNNWNKFARDYFPSVQNAPWCGAFVGAILILAGFDPRGKVWIPYVPYVMAWAKKIGAWSTTEYEDGDLTIFNWRGRGVVDHIGFAWKDRKSSRYRSIEGNTQPGDAGNQGEGGGVYVRYRKRSDIAGWVRMSKVLEYYGIKAAGNVAQAAQNAAQSAAHAPKQAGAALTVDGSAGNATVREIQTRLKEISPNLVVDGVGGSATVTALQAWFDLKVRDGIISGQNTSSRAAMPGFSKSVFGAGSKGSTLVRCLQAYAGSKVDGQAGKGTWTDVQKMLNAYPAFLRRADFNIAHARLKAAGLR